MAYPCDYRAQQAIARYQIWMKTLREQVSTSAPPYWTVSMSCSVVLHVMLYESYHTVACVTRRCDVLCYAVCVILHVIGSDLHSSYKRDAPLFFLCVCLCVSLASGLFVKCIHMFVFYCSMYVRRVYGG